MGNSTSEKKESNHVNDSAEGNEYEEKASFKSDKLKQRIQKETAEATAKFQKLLNETRKSIDADGSTPNLIDNYAKLRTFEQPHLDKIDSLVDQMKQGWQGIMDSLPSIRKYCGDVGKEKADTMEQIHTDYWYLLLKTRSKIGTILTQCKIQKSNVQELYDILQEGSKTTLSDDDKLAHNDCIRCLGKWIKTDDIKQLINEWKEMSDKLQKEEKAWKELAKEAAKYWSNIAWKIAKIAAITAGLIILIAAVTFTALWFAPGYVAFGVVAVAASNGAAVSTGISASAVLGAGITAASITFLAGTAVSARNAYIYKQEIRKVRDNVNILAEKIEGMLKAAKRIEKQLNDVEKAQQDIVEGLDYMKDTESVRILKKSYKRIIEYLDEYIRQGTILTETIEKAVAKYIQM